MGVTHRTNDDSINERRYLDARETLVWKVAQRELENVLGYASNWQDYFLEMPRRAKHWRLHDPPFNFLVETEMLRDSIAQCSVWLICRNAH